MAQHEVLNQNIFEYLKSPRNVLGYGLFRGVPDFANLRQFNLYEGGYSFFVVLGIPKFMEKLKTVNDKYANIIDVCIYVIEYEFKGLDGIEGITSDPGEISDGKNTLEVINKVTRTVNWSISTRYQEKSGSLITKFMELYLRGIKDPMSGVKTYYGMIPNKILEAGYENEVFQFMYIVTDNTVLNLEKAFYFATAQPTNSDWNIYESEKGNYEFKEVSITFKTFAVTGVNINKTADRLRQEIYDNTVWDETAKNFTGVADAHRYLANYYASEENQ